MVCQPLLVGVIAERCPPMAERVRARVPCAAASCAEKAHLLVSSDFAYGPEGRAPVIPPNADLHFEVQLCSLQRAGVQQDQEQLTKQMLGTG